MTTCQKKALKVDQATNKNNQLNLTDAQALELLGSLGIRPEPSYGAGGSGMVWTNDLRFENTTHQINV